MAYLYPIGQVRKKSANKPKKANKQVIQEDEEMNKILTALRFFKDHTNTNNSPVITKNDKDQEKENNEKENIQDRDRTASGGKDSESRPRTARCKRASKNRRKSGNSSGGHSALGFHSNLQNHPLLHNIETYKNPHNRSVNVAPDSSRIVKKRKISKGRVSPNAFAIRHQRHPSGPMNHIHNVKNTSLDKDKISVLKSRPRSAKLKKKSAKGERSKKNSVNRLANNSFAKGSMTAHGFMDHSILKEDPSFDNDDRTLMRFMKKHNCNIKKTNTKLKSQNYVAKPSKFVVYKHPSSKPNMPMPYDHMSYIEDLQKMHNNIEDLMRNKTNPKLEAKKRKAIAAKKKKHRRSATPQLVN